MRDVLGSLQGYRAVDYDRRFLKINMITARPRRVGKDVNPGMNSYWPLFWKHNNSM